MGRARQLDGERYRKVAELRSWGWTLAAIGERFGLTYHQVHYILKVGPPPARPAILCCACGSAIAAARHPCDEGETHCVACVLRWPGATLGQRLRAFRLASGLSCTDLAGRAGIAAIRVRDYERGVKKPNLTTKARLARALGVSLKALERGGPARRAE
jgi:DNA-binding XRE family transcriptional regulator